MPTIARNTKSAKKPEPRKPVPPLPGFVMAPPFDGVSRLLAELRAAPPDGYDTKRAFVVEVLAALVYILANWQRAHDARLLSLAFLRVAARLEHEPNAAPEPLAGAYGATVRKLGKLVAETERTANAAPNPGLEALLSTLYSVHRAADCFGRGQGRASMTVLNWTPSASKDDGPRFSVGVCGFNLPAVAHAAGGASS